MSKIEVVEVGPRDGFQSVKCAPPIATELKLDVIDQLVSAGVKHMEYSDSFTNWNGELLISLCGQGR